MSKPPTSLQETPLSVVHTLHKAISAMKSQRPGAAEGLASEVLQADPGNVVAYQILGEALLLQNKASEAVDVLEVAALRSRDPGTETLLAMALTAAGRNEEALEPLRLATTRRPCFPLAFIELGQRLGDRGAYQEGVTVLELGLSLTPESNALRLSLGYLHLKYNARGKAKAVFGEVLAFAPDQHNGLLAMAKVLAMDGENTSAISLYRRALELRPDDAVTAVGLGKCLLETGARGEGEAALQRAAQAEGPLTGPALIALAATTHGRLFLNLDAAMKFMGVSHF